MLDLKKFKETFLYVLFGVLTTVVNIGIYFIFTRIFRIDYFTSNTVALIISILFAYITNKFFVFKSKSIEKILLIKEFISFISCRLLSGIAEIIMMLLMINILGINDFVVKIISNIIVIILNFIFSKFIVFRKIIDI